MRLERAALRCFVRRGVDAATTKEIARAARMSEGNLYRHYRGKEAMAWAIYASRLAGFVRELDKVAAGAGTVRERFRELVRRFHGLFREDPDTYRYIVLVQHRHMARTREGLRTPTDVLADLLVEGQRKGEVRKGSARLMAVMIVGLVIRVTLLKMGGGLKESPEALEREAAAAGWRVAGNGK